MKKLRRIYKMGRLAYKWYQRAIRDGYITDDECVLLVQQLADVGDFKLKVGGQKQLPEAGAL